MEKQKSVKPKELENYQQQPDFSMEMEFLAEMEASLTTTSMLRCWPSSGPS